MSGIASKKSVLTCDLLASQHVAAKDLAKEPELMSSCWWEYRGLHPTRRTFIFAEVYANMTKRYHGKYWDYVLSTYKMGFSGQGPEKIFPSALDDEKKTKRKKMVLTGMWRARQTADELGISYSIYVSSCFEHASANGWKNLPRPSQLYSDKMKMVALDEQAKELLRYTPDFTNPGLMAGSKAPFKADFDKWLYELGLLKRYDKAMTYTRMVEQGYLTQAQADAWAELALNTA